MNFTKYIVSLVLFATAAFASESETNVKNNAKTESITFLRDGMTKCQQYKEIKVYLDCMKQFSPHVAAKAFKHIDKDVDTISDEDLKAILNTPEPYSTLFMCSIVAVIVLSCGGIIGGIYKFRKSPETDL